MLIHRVVSLNETGARAAGAAGARGAGAGRAAAGRPAPAAPRGWPPGASASGPALRLARRGGRWRWQARPSHVLTSLVSLTTDSLTAPAGDTATAARRARAVRRARGQAREAGVVRVAAACRRGDWRVASGASASCLVNAQGGAGGAALNPSSPLMSVSSSAGRECLSGAAQDRVAWRTGADTLTQAPLLAPAVTSRTARGGLGLGHRRRRGVRQSPCPDPHPASEVK